MTIVFIYSLCILAAGAVVWVTGQALERHKHAEKIQGLETRLKVIQNRSQELGEQVVRLQTELTQSHSQLEEEKKENVKLSYGAGAALRKRTIFMGMLGVMSGVFLGGMVLVPRVENNYLRKMSVLQASQAVSESQSRSLQRQVEKLEGKMDELQTRLQNEMELRVIAETKLDIILEQDFDSGSQTKKHKWDFTKWKRDSSSHSAAKDTPLVSISASAI